MRFVLKQLSSFCTFTVVVESCRIVIGCCNWGTSWYIPKRKLPNCYVCNVEGHSKARNSIFLTLQSIVTNNIISVVCYQDKYQLNWMLTDQYRYMIHWERNVQQHFYRRATSASLNHTIKCILYFVLLLQGSIYWGRGKASPKRLSSTPPPLKKFSWKK